MNSRSKGVRGELEVAHLFQRYGIQAERGQQHDGMSGHADVVGVPYIWTEVKRRESLDLLAAMEQAERDSAAYMENHGIRVVPVVIHRANREAWKVSTKVHYFLEFFGAGCGTSMDGMVTMLFGSWIEIYLSYKEERDRG